MPLQNRVTPLGELVAVPARGLVYGTRGCLHDGAGRIRRHHNGKRWIACRLEFRGWLRRPLLQPGRFTELFFLDEATAFAAGHRPCALCRREDYNAFLTIWSGLHPGRRGADGVDAQLHDERLESLTHVQRRHDEGLDGLPDGTIVLYEGAPRLVRGTQLLAWSPSGYGSPQPRPTRRRVTVITPASLVEVLRNEWHPVVPLVHPSADRPPGETTAVAAGRG
jgi:hypothetical protein